MILAREKDMRKKEKTYSMKISRTKTLWKEQSWKIHCTWCHVPDTCTWYLSAMLADRSMHMCSTVFDKGTKVSQWRRHSLLKNAAWTIKYAYAKKKRKTMTLNSYQVKIFISLLAMGLNISESESHSVVSNSLWPHGLYSPWNSPGQNTGVGSLSLLQRIFPTQGLNPGLLPYRWILY